MLRGKPGSGKETRHFVISIAGSALRYTAGDALGVYPSNRPSDVEEILRALGATGAEPVMLPKATEPLSLREALASRVALSGPTRKFLELLARNATEPAGKARLVGLLDPSSDAVMKGFLEQRWFVDLLEEFPSARPTPQDFVDSLRRLMPRLYSIASSPRVHPHDIHLTVAVVRYSTNGRDRVGVCSSFLADRALPGKTPVPVFVSASHFGPPEDPSRDIIMVGPGTGIAPFRGFVQDRIAVGATGRNWIFFGEQHRRTDFLYEEEWADLVAKGKVARFDTAFSRDQLHKLYVQDRMRENAAEIWAWLQGGAYFYVCGDAKRMAKDVDTALHEIVAHQGGMSQEAAVEWVKALKKDKRYQRDVY